MSSIPPILLAYGETNALDVVIWLIAGVAWLILQANAAKRKKARPPHATQSPSPPAAAGGESPSPDELAEIFKRLGANIPATPPPAAPPRPAKAASRPAGVAVPTGRPRAAFRKAAQMNPEIARRLARVKQEVEQAARLTGTESTAAPETLQGIVSQRSDSRAASVATRHSQVILPRIHAMDLHLVPWPVIPMPGFDRSHHAGKPYRTRLHTFRELREAVVALTLLRPPKSFAP